MAIFEFSNDDPNGARPIAAHPAFPAVVAMWFAVLLGLGTLVLPAALIDWLLPPMDPNGRMLAALGTATAGALAGFAAARRIAASCADTSQTGSGGECPVRPLSAYEELGELLDWAEPDFPHRDALASRDPLPREETGSDLTELVERLGQAIARHRAMAAVADRATVSFAPEPASSGYVSDDTEAALRSALARLRQLREAA